MTLRHFIQIVLAVLVLLWLAAGTMPYKLTVLEEEPGASYDTFISSQEFLLEKKLDRLNKSKSASRQLKLDTKEELALVFWSQRKHDEALKLYRQANQEREKLSGGYDQKLINNLICLAGLYRDMNLLDDSIDCYEKIWQLDKAHLAAGDPRLARDQTSMAVIAYVCGEIQESDMKHEQFMKNCLAHINNAQDILQKQSTPQTAKLANLLYLKDLAFRALGDKSASKICRQAADNLTKKLNSPYYLPRT